MTAVALDAVQGALCDIPGIRDIEATLHDPDSGLLIVRFTGWGPSLHKRRFSMGMYIEGTMHPVDDGEGDAADEDETGGTRQDATVSAISQALHNQVQGQRTLSRMGEAYGLLVPMPRPGDPADVDTSGSSIGHLHIDTATIEALLDAMTPEDVVRHLADAVADAIGGDGDEMDQEVHSANDPSPLILTYPTATADEEYATLSINGGQCRMSLSRTLKGPDGLVRATVADGYVRFEPDLLGAIPETVGTMLVGKPLSTLADTGCPRLNAMAIGEIADTGGGIDVRLVTGRARLAGHAVLGRLVTSPGDDA